MNFDHFWAQICHCASHVLFVERIITEQPKVCPVIGHLLINYPLQIGAHIKNRHFLNVISKLASINLECEKLQRASKLVRAGHSTLSASHLAPVGWMQ